MDFQAFIEKIDSDAEFAAEFNDFSDLNAVVELAKKKGYNISVADFEA